MSWGLGRYAGPVLPPTAWAINTQLGQILPYTDCNSGISWTSIGAIAAIVVAAAGILACYGVSGQTSRTGVFVGRVSLFFGLTLSFALFLQAAAALLVNPCAR
jgi:hypothetical protein